MTDEIAIYKAIVARERASRQEAERLLEEKARELYDKSRDLERFAAELEEANKLFSRIMDLAPNGVILLGEDFCVRAINRGGALKFVLRPRRAVGTPIEALMPGLAARLKAMPQGNFHLDTQEARRPDGTSFMTEIHGHVGQISEDVRCLLVVHDITNRLARKERERQIKEQMDEARRLEAIGSLSAGLAHEINTPIQFVGDNLDYLEEELRRISQTVNSYRRLRVTRPDDPEAARLAARILEVERQSPLSARFAETFEALSESRDGIRQVRDIVLLMRDFAHPGTDEVERHDLNEIARNAVRLCRNRQGKGTDLLMELSRHLPRVPCRRGQLQQAILNLVMNAIDALEEAGTPDALVRIATEEAGGTVRVIVSDNGPGVPDSLKQKIFDPFFTTKPVGKGTGQGLALAKDYIVKGHGGRLVLEDLPGYATSFVIELPMAADPAEGAHATRH